MDKNEIIEKQFLILKTFIFCITLMVFMFVTSIIYIFYNIYNYDYSYDNYELNNSNQINVGGNE